MKTKFIFPALILGAGLAWGQTVLVGGTLLNGDFNNPDSDATFAQLAHWENLGTGAQTVNATKNNNAYDGSRHAVLGYLPDSKIFGMDTGYSINNGDVFDISYVWKDGWKWTDGADQVRVSLFVTDDNSISGVRTDLVVDLSGLSASNGAYETVDRDSLYEASSSDAGKTLFVAIDTVIDDESYAYMDNFELTVSADSVAPANPNGLQVVAGDGNAFVSWTTNSEPDLASYNLYRSTTSGSYGVPLATNLTDNEYFDTGVTNGTPHHYVVTAVDTSGNESGFSNEETAIPMDYPIYSMKKGVGNASGNKPLQKERVEGLHASWYYAWSMDRNFKMNSSIEFVPMRHNKWWPGLENLANCGTFTNVLAWNEPYQMDGNDPTPEEAVVGGQYQDIVDAALLYGAPGTRIGSPSVHGTNDWWQLEFMPMAAASNLTIDFIATHAYPSPNGLLNKLRRDCDALWAKYGKPVWVTEFNGADWAGTNSWTMVDTYTSMIETLHYFESTPYVERYAVFPWDATWAAGAPSHIFEVEIDGGETNTTSILTPLGKLYAEYRSIDIGGPYEDTWYYLHNKSSGERLFHSGPPGMTNIYTEGTDVCFEIADADAGNIFIVNRNTGKRLGYSSSESSFYWSTTATGPYTQWSLTDAANGWKYITHVGTGKRLSGDALGVVSGGTDDDSVRWAFVRANPLSTDLDSDALPDTWEIEQFGSLVTSEGGSDNFDGDVHSDWVEYVAGTAAADAASFFHVSQGDAGEGTIQVTFDGVTNRTYVLETAESLVSNVWNSVQSIGPLPTNGVQMLQYTGDSDALFGRVRISN